MKKLFIFITVASLINMNHTIAMEEKWWDPLAYQAKRKAAPTIAAQTLTDQVLEAVENNNLYKIKDLLKQGADLNRANKYGSSPLGTAIVLNNLKMIDLLVKHGADIQQKNKYGEGFLHKAASYSDQKTINHLIDTYKLDANARDNYDLTPLHHAAGEENNIEAVKALLANDADINASDSDGDTPLSIAVSHKNTEIINLLSQHADESKHQQ